jgi:hypothetical protein
MVNFKCPRCGEIFNRNAKYIRHIQSKNMCYPILENVIPSENNYISISNNIFCDYCDKSFMDQYNLKKHFEVCIKKKLADKEDEQTKINKKLYDLLTTMQHNQSMQLTLVPATQVSTPVAVQVSAPVAIDNSTNLTGDNNSISNVQNNVQSNSKNKINNNNNNQNLNVTFSYNNPDLSHISDHDYKSCINAKLKSVPKLITKIHFNPDKPENHNIYLEDMDSEYINVYDGTQWKRKKKDYFVDDAVTINENMLQRWVEYKEDPVMQNALNRYYDLRDEEGMEERIQQDVLQTIFNNRRFAEKKYKAWKKEEEERKAEMESKESKEFKESLTIQM